MSLASSIRPYKTVPFCRLLSSERKLKLKFELSIISDELTGKGMLDTTPKRIAHELPVLHFEFKRTLETVISSKDDD